MKSLKNKIIISLAICLTIFTGVFASLFLNNNKKNVYADDSYQLVVAKYKLIANSTVKDYVLKNGVLYKNSVSAENKIEPEQTLNNNITDTTMLCNANLEKDTNGNLLKEFLVVSFAAKSGRSFVGSVQVNATLDSALNSVDTLKVRAIDTKERMSTGTTTSQEYFQFFDLTDIKYTNSETTNPKNDEKLFTQIDEFTAQGQYKFTFSYNIEEQSGLNTSISFNLLNENYYLNANTDSSDNIRGNTITTPQTPATTPTQDDKNNFPYIENGKDESVKSITFHNVYNKNLNTNPNHTEPRLYNTERLDRQLDANDTKIEYNYFNYTNINTTDYDGKQVATDDNNPIKYPTLDYDPSKYNVSYTKTLYGITTIVTSQFVVSEGNGKVIFTYETNGKKTVKEFLANRIMPNYYIKDTNGNFVKNTSTSIDKNVEYYFDNTGKIVYSPFYNYSFSLLIDELGSYVFDFDYAIMQNASQQIFANGSQSQIKKENWKVIGTENLTIFGYQLKYSDYKNESGALDSELKNIEKNLYADVSNANALDGNIANILINSDYKNESGTIIDFNYSDTLNANKNNVSTNQAPLFFKYFASMISDGAVSKSYYVRYNKKGGYRYDNNGTLIEKQESALTDAEKNSSKINITSNSRFVDNGYYEVFVSYTYPDYKNIDTYLNTAKKVATSDMTKIQVFSFTIANVEPKIVFKTVKVENDKDVYGNFDANGFTNQNVFVSWQEAMQSPFDVKPNVKVGLQKFDENTYTNITSKIKFDNINGNFTVSESGHYVVTVEYGPCIYDSTKKEYLYSASVTYKFTIDKESINNYIDIKQVNQVNSENVISSDSTFVDNIISNQNFVTTYGKGNSIIKDGQKNSGAKITMSYSFLPITENNIYSYNMETDFITNGKVVNSINENIAYSQLVDTNLTKNKIVDINTDKIFTSDGIYILNYIDEAKNTTTKYIIKDTSTPITMQNCIDTPTDSDWKTMPIQNNIVNKNTNIAWAKFKAIEIASNDIKIKNILDILVNGTKANENVKFILDNTKYYLLVSVSDATLSVDKTNVNDFDSTKSKYQIVVDATQASEPIYKLEAEDVCGNKTTRNIEVSFDKSHLQSYISGSPANNKQEISKKGNLKTTNGNADKNRLLPDNITNKQILVVNWIDKAGTNDSNYTINSVSYDFYPLNFDTTSANYPYAKDATQKSISLLDNTTITKNVESINNELTSFDKIESQGINLSQDSRYDANSTTAGMYVITRKYTNSTGTSGDYKDKTITLYVDRNNLITKESAISGGIIGSEIKFTMGYGTTDAKTFAGSNFLQEFIDNYVVETNKLPVVVSIPKYKYSLSTIPNTTMVNELSCKISSVEVDDKDIKHKQNTYSDEYTLLKSGIYIVNIYDTANKNIDETSEQGSTATSVQFKISLNVSAPEVNFVDNKTQVNLLGEPSVNNKDVSVVWQNDTTGYKAKIDDSNIKVVVCSETNGKKNIPYTLFNGNTLQSYIKTDSNDKNKKILNLSDILTDSALKSAGIEKNKSFYCEITMQYYGDPQNYGENFSKTRRIYFDYEIPQYNYNLLLSNDKLLTNDEKSSFYNYTSTKNFENYAFNVDKNWTLKRKIDTASSDNFYPSGIKGGADENDAIITWYRSYNKYPIENNENAESSQSIVPSDSRFSDISQAPLRYRFSPNLTINGKNIYTKITQDVDTITFQPNKYYEIIEMDTAGNYRVYTIYVLDGNWQINYDQNIVFDFDNPNNNPIFPGTSNGIVTYDSKSAKYEINNKGIAFTSFANFGQWFDVTIENKLKKEIKTLKCSPIQIDNYLTTSELIKQLNNLIKPSASNNGDVFTITFKTGKYEVFTIEYNTPTSIPFELKIDDVSVAGKCVVTIDNTQLKGTYIKEFETYEAKNGQIIYDNEHLVKEPGTSFKNLNKDDIKNISFTFSTSQGRNLWFVYTDNFGVTQKKNVILGISQTNFDTVNSDNGMLKFKGNYKLTYSSSKNGKKIAEYYSNKQVTFQYQSQIFSIVSINSYDAKDEKNPTDKTGHLSEQKNTNGVSYFDVFELNDIDKDMIYLIVFKDTSDIEYTYKLHYFTLLAQIKFIDSSGYEHIFQSTATNDEEVISRTVHLSFDKNEYANFETFVSVLRSYYDANGNSMTQDYGKVSNEFIFDSYGTYTVIANNELGTKIEYKFELKQSSATYYSVIVKPDGKTSVELAPSEVKYNYNGKEIDQYISIYNATVDVNQTKNLISNKLTTDESATQIYEIKTNDNALVKYSNFIAITKVTASTNLLAYTADKSDNVFMINGTNISTKSYTSKDKQIAITIPSYFETPDNKLKITCVFDDENVGRIMDYTTSNDNKTITFNLTNAGVYKIYISDLAGNSHLFGTSKYFTLYLLNNVLYTLNGERGIYNAIYNQSVELGFSQVERFTKLPSPPYYIIISATLNGENYNLTSNSGTYSFTNYGTYFVTMSAFVGDSTVEENKVTTVVKFSIINQNEARLIHEYIGLNGYEITNIVKDDNDITDSIRNSLHMTTLNQVAIAGGLNGIGGNGHYTITVKANYDKIIGSHTFTYKVWLNNDTDTLILCSLKEGEKTTNTIFLKLNLNQIYSKIGECKVKLNGNDFITINASTSATSEISTYQLTTNQRYNVTLETSSGNTALSFVVTKVEPLNTVAIIVIVIVSVVVVSLTITFILLRKKMRIK